jgi:prophage DNA circulation protein
VTDCIAPVYLDASWKGVPFFVENSADEFGRRGDLYEYPLSDDIGYKDLGRKARRFKVEGYLIGTDQVGLTQEMASAAESPEPGTLDHPMYGSQQVACVSLTTSADYRKDKKRTKLAFEFVEANPSMAPFAAGFSIGQLFNIGSDAVTQSQASAMWAPTQTDNAVTRDISNQLGQLIAPATDEESYDAIDMLNRGWESVLDRIARAALVVPQSQSIFDPVGTPIGSTPTTYATYSSFLDATDPINYGTATVRRIHDDDALARLRSFNSYVVTRSTGISSISTQSLVVTARLALVRDFALVVAQATYDTVKAALDDLDFVMAVYDEELAIATRHCDDPLVAAIYKARATAASTILGRNIRLPGLAETNVGGVWPSLVVAQKLYGDGTRYQQVENYNSLQNPYFMGRDIIAPAA